jgi:hypothetical protein
MATPFVVIGRLSPANQALQAKTLNLKMTANAFNSYLQTQRIIGLLKLKMLLFL